MKIVSLQQRFLFTCLLVFAAAFCKEAAACANGVAVISGRTNYPPLSWRDSDKLEGSTVDIATIIFAELGIKAIPDEGGPWKRVLLRAKDGEVDLLLGVRKTVERKEYLNYIDPPITPAVQSVFVSQDRDFTFKQWEDLKGKTGNITLGTSFGTQFENYRQKNLSIEYTETFERGFQKLLLNRVDYVLGPNTTFELYLQKEDLLGKITPKEQPLNILDEYFAFPKKSACNQYQAHFKKRLTEITKSEKIDRVLEENFIIWFERHDPDHSQD